MHRLTLCVCEIRCGLIYPMSVKIPRNSACFKRLTSRAPPQKPILVPVLERIGDVPVHSVEAPVHRDFVPAHSVEAPVHSVEALCTRSKCLCTRSRSQCTRPKCLCTRPRSLCTRSKSLCTRSTSLCTRSKSLCTRPNPCTLGRNPCAQCSTTPFVKGTCGDGLLHFIALNALRVVHEEVSAHPQQCSLVSL